MPTAAPGNARRMNPTSSEAAPRAGGSALARLLSGLAAAALTLLLLAYPLALASPDGKVSHAALSLMLTGLGGSWAHALGYRASSLLARAWTYPALAWSLMLLGLVLSRSS